MDICTDYKLQELYADDFIKNDKRKIQHWINHQPVFVWFSFSTGL